MSSAKKHNLLLPVVKWLVAKHPVPLSVNCVANSEVSEEQARCIVGIKAGQLSLVCVAIALAIAWDECSVDPVCVPCKSFLQANTIGVWGDGSSSFNSLLKISNILEIAYI